MLNRTIYKRLAKVLASIWLLAWLAMTTDYAQGAPSDHVAGIAPSIFVQRGHNDWVDSVAFSPDGQTVVSGSGDKSIKFWNVATGREIRTLFGHSDAVSSVAFSPDGAQLISGSYDMTIKLWNTTTGSLIRTLTGHSEAIHSVAFSSDGRTIVSAAGDKTVRLWDTATGLNIRTLTGHTKSVGAVAISKDGKIVVSGSADGSLKFWDITTGRDIRTIVDHKDVMRSVAFSPDGRIVASCGDDNAVTLWDVSTGREIRSLTGHGSDVKSVAFSLGGNILASAGADKAIKLWDVATGREIFTLSGQSSEVEAVAFSPDGKKLVSGGYDGSIKLWDISLRKEIPIHNNMSKGVMSVIFSPNGNAAISLNKGGDINLWNMETGRQVRAFLGSSGHILSTSFAPDGNSVAAGGADGNIIIWNAITGHKIRTLTGHTSRVTSVAFSPNGENLASISDDQSLRFWDTANGKNYKTILFQQRGSWSLVYSPDGKTLASGARDGSIKVWSALTGKELITIEELMKFLGTNVRSITSSVWSIQFSEKGKSIISVGLDGKIKYWDISTGKIKRKISAHAGIITSQVISKDGNFLVTGGFDKTLKIWDLKNNQLLATLTGHSGWVNSVDLSPDGKMLVSGGEEGAVKLWRISDGALLGTIFQSGSADSIVMTPEGYFDASSYAAADAINVVQGMKVQGVGDFWDVFYRPDIVQAKLRGEDIRPLIGEMTMEKALQNPPPRVAFGAVPAQTLRTRLTVPYEVKSQGGGISEIRVFHNGKLVQSDGVYKDAVGKTLTLVAARSDAASAHAKGVRATRGGSYEDRVAGGSPPPDAIVRKAVEKSCNPCQGVAEIDVLPGEENTVTVVAFNRDGTIQSAPATAHFRSTLPKEAPHLWILPVGIDHYASFGKLQNAAKDARDFVCTYAGKAEAKRMGLACEQAGVASGLFKPENIHVVTPLFDQGASKAAILAGLAEVAAKAKPQDTFIWFVSSHGMMDANSLFGVIANDTQCTARDGKGNCTDVRGHITSNEILEASKKIQAMKQLMVLDTCQSGGLDSKLSGLYDARMSLLAKNMGLHMYAAAQSTEEAQDGTPGGNGVFTAQLLEGLRGKAPDSNKDQRISIVELGDYARSQTIEQSKANKYPQHPVVQHFGQDAPLLRVGGAR